MLMTELLEAAAAGDVDAVRAAASRAAEDLAKWKESPDSDGGSGDRLERIFSMQLALQERMYPDGMPTHADLDPESKKLGSVAKSYYTVMTTALVDEAMEALRRTPWKPWKKQQELDLAGLREELADALHFYVNLCLWAGMSAADLFEEYCGKNRVNHERQDGGY